MADQQEFSTPMMRQYIKIKEQYPDAILFFRLGDFYEMFLEDAKVGAKVLGITLTARHKGKDGRVPMAGVPYHAAENYIHRLVKNGYKVAICEQVSEVEKGRDVVDREVVRVVTPSTILSDVEHKEYSHPYLMTFAMQGRNLGVCLIEVSTGEVLVAQEKFAQPKLDQKGVLECLNEYIARFQPAEILLPGNWYDQTEIVKNFHQQNVSPFRFSLGQIKIQAARDKVLEQFQADSLEGFGLEHQDAAILALSHALLYLQETQKSKLAFLQFPRLVLPKEHLYLNGQTIRNLEIFASLRSGAGDTSLFGILNQTITPMGSRKLKKWLLRPLLDANAIDERLDVVEKLVENSEQRIRIQEMLAGVTDVEKSISRLSIGIGNTRDLIGIKQALNRAVELQQILGSHSELKLLQNTIRRINWERVTSVISLLEKAILDEPSALLTEGGIIREEFSPELDGLREIAHGGRDWLTQLERKEKEATGISSLKLGFNKVFGYYIEVSKTNLHKVPMHYVRKQTLVNAERYIIPDLKEHEEKVLQAEERVNQLEYDLYQKIVAQVLQDIADLQHTAHFLATGDVLCSLAQVALENHYARSQFAEDSRLRIEDGRHPVVEKNLVKQFVPNSLCLGSETQKGISQDARLMILTGANMAGKSTYIRQAALIVIMTQIGSFVPASLVKMGLVDQIHTRIGAMDNLAAGLSTFMVEMVETATILNNLTDQSLVILDEVGRGTSTYDGLAIAWAVSEHLIQKSKAKVLFATHYLELTKLAEKHSEVINFHLAVAEEQNEVTFLYSVQAGKSNQSYGIQVAKHAGLPKSVIERAEEILGKLNEQNRSISPIQEGQRSLF